MKPSKSDLTRFGSNTFTRTSRVLSVLSAAILFTGCYTKLATDGDHWGYTGPVKQKVVVRETEDTIVVKETRVIHQPQPVVTDTLTYTNTATGEQNVVVNNYFAPPPATFGAYDPWTNTYPTWYDDYWYRPHATIVISIGDPHYHHHSRWFDHHWRRHSYYQSYWDYNYYYPWNGWYHASYRGPGWAYYDPYYPYPPVYGYGYGCYVPAYDPFYDPFYGHGYYGGYYGGYHGHGHHGYYGDNDDHGRDENGRERRRGNVGGEERGRGGVTTDGGTPNSGVTLPREGSSPVRLPEADRVKAVPVSSGATRNPASGSTTTTNGGTFNGGPSQPNTGKGVGSVEISTGSIPLDADSDPGFGSKTNVREVKSSPAQNAPGRYEAPAPRNTTASTKPVEVTPAERRPEAEVTTTRSTTSAPSNVVKNSDASSTTRSTTAAEPRPAGRNSTSASPTPARSNTSQTPSYTPRSGSSSSGSSSSGASNTSSTSGSGSYNSGRVSGSSTSSAGSSSSSSGSSSRSSDSRGSDSRSNSDGGGRGRR